MWLFLYGTFSKWTRPYDVPCLQNSPVTLIPTFWRLLSFFLWLLTFQEFVTYSVPSRKNTVVWHPYQGKLTINFDSHLRGGNVNCILIKPKSPMSLNGFPESLPLFNWCMEPTNQWWEWFRENIWVPTFGAFSITPSQIVMESAIRHKTKYQVVERNLHTQVAEIALCRLLMRLSTSKKVALKSVLQLNVS
jgi:hypothetical protein